MAYTQRLQKEFWTDCESETNLLHCEVKLFGPIEIFINELTDREIK